MVDDVSFTIEPGEMFFLLGPSGCGKTTVLRMLAGFLAAGRRRHSLRRAADERRRAAGPQHRDGLPELRDLAAPDRLRKLAYGPRARKLRRTIDRRVADALRVARLEEFAQRKPAQLSGGQQQRVALARALAVEPGPDPARRAALESRRAAAAGAARRVAPHPSRDAHDRLYVTHDQEEALSLADRLAVMNRGRIEQIGTPRDIYEQPANEFTARFMGEINILPPEARSPRRCRARRTGSSPSGRNRRGSAARACIATVKLATYLGSKTELLVESGDGRIAQVVDHSPTRRRNAASRPAGN